MIREVGKYALILALILAGALAFVRLEDRKRYGLRTGEPAPNLVLRDFATDKDVSLESFRGKVVLVNFWATFCGPCVAEMPSLERLHETLAHEGLVVLGVSVDTEGPELQRFLTARGIRFEILRDPGGSASAGAYRTTGYPETYVIGPTGTLLESYIGPAEWDTPEAIGHFRDLLKSARTSPTR
jgi:peroxiredoxin